MPLPLFYCYCCYVTITTALKLLLLSHHPITSAFPGASELTTPLLRRISILCFPLCRINKFRFYFPRRPLRSPILVGHQDYFLAPLPGRHNSTHKFTWGVHSTFLSVFILPSLLLSSIILLINLLLSSLFLSSFIFLIYQKIHKILKKQKSKKLLLWKNMLEPLWNYKNYL